MALAPLVAVTLDCPDPEALAAFYRGVIGGEIAVAGPDFVALAGAPVGLGFQRATNPEPGWPDPAGPLRTHLEFRVDPDRLDEIEEQAVALGARRPPTQPRPGSWRVLLDPAGHLFCLTSVGPDPAVSVADRAAITEVIARHGHLVDDGHLDRLAEVFTSDVVYDVSPLGAEPLHGLDAVRSAARSLGEANPVAHHVTNVALDALGDDRVQARSKGLGIGADGSCGSVTYDDVVVRTDAGWRIARRRVTPRRAPLGG